MLSRMAAIAPIADCRLPKSRSMPDGSAWAYIGYDVTHSANAMLVVTMIRVAVVGEVDLAQGLDADDGDGGEQGQRRAAEHGLRNRGDDGGHHSEGIRAGS